jgi:pseudouridine-5'-phosphate glycosidase
LTKLAADRDAVKSRRRDDIDIAAEVEHALQTAAPIVALESTIIAHGMTYPNNVETARSVEQIIRDEGAVPATIAVLAGRVTVGLSDAELDHIARTSNIHKASTHDLAFAIVTRRDAATTVAATMRVAAMVGIRIFATGGIGGVHLGGAETFDISADITELGRTNVAVVSAGAKAILDLRATLEVLETATVPVIAFRSDDFPAFFSPTSGLKAPLRLDSTEQIAEFLHTKWRLGLTGGALIANPIAAEDAIDAASIAEAIEAATRDSRQQPIIGKAVTPFLLARLLAITGGKSLRANMALVKNNARLAARIAVALRQIETADREGKRDGGYGGC